ncbi:hypothetical protein BA177_05030 [Woeseia oceani]|uniref:Uncharacterized protein n=2 Tax=Woeseia oceani TaxID=1548547 RepID=A0A193LDS1_9GAMM|nr:hypothetical protein BA177_05030 [Woeseia oceani]
MGNDMSKEFTECVVLGKDAFDPDAVFLDDIVDDEVLPYLSLAVDGLTDSSDARRGRLEMRPGDDAANEVIQPSTVYPSTNFDPDQLEVYGWESSWWRKIKGYLGF